MAQTVRTNNYPAPTAQTIIADDYVTVPAAAGQLRRISWGAVFAGIALAVVVQMTLYLLGLSIGALTVNPLTEQDPFEGLGTAVVIWDAATTLIALFIGGWVAGRLAGIPSQLDGTLHGLIVWASTVIVSLLLFTTTVGGLVNGTANLLGQTAAATTSIVEAAAPQVADAIDEAAEAAGVPLSGEALRERAALVIEENTGLEIEITDPEAFDQILTDFAIAATDEDGVTAADREALQTSLVEVTTLTEAEIEEVIATVETNVDQFVAEAQQTAEQVQQQATVAAENAAEVLAALAGVLFASLVVGAFAAGMGGYVGAPQVTAEMESAT